MFFALWPDRDTQRDLGKLARDLGRECGGRAVPGANIHLTLVFLGNIERHRLPRLETLAAGIRGAPFELTLDCVEYWRHNRIVWAGTRRCPEALQELVAGLGRALRAEGLRTEERPYVPHITLLRNARRPPAVGAAPGLVWTVREFALVESAPQARGRVYQVLRVWPLTA